MLYVNLVAFFMAVGFPVAYIFLKRYSCNNNDLNNKENAYLWFLLILGVGLIIRFICAVNYSGHRDLLCFASWSESVYKRGFSSFYTTDALADYPPGYLYILYVIAFIRNIFGMENGSVAHTFLLKIPGSDMLYSLFQKKVLPLIKMDFIAWIIVI